MDESIRLLTQTIYNKLSEEKAHAAYMWRHTGGSDYHESIWDKRWWDMRAIEESVHKEGYEFIETGTKVNGKVQSSVYTLVEMNGYAKRLVSASLNASATSPLYTYIYRIHEGEDIRCTKIF